MGSRSNRPKTCRYSTGRSSIHVVYVMPGCHHAGLVKGVLICSPEDCKTCLHYEKDEGKEITLKKNRTLLVELTERYTAADYETTYAPIKKRQCKYCKYFGGTKDYAKNSMCDYILMTGKIRPCDPADCVSAGIFEKPKSKRKQSPLPTMIVKRWQ